MVVGGLSLINYKIPCTSNAIPIQPRNLNYTPPIKPYIIRTPRLSIPFKSLLHLTPTVKASEKNSNPETVESEDGEVNNLGVRAALSMLKFYKREISPLLPNSCRYVPTCSEYSMMAYKKYGVVKGTVLTAWRLCRCNPLGGSGYDPPRWFDEISPHEEHMD